MRSPATRVALSAATWVALGTAAAFIIQSERSFATRRAAALAFDTRSHEVSAALADLRTAQQAFVAPGQEHGIWASQADEFLAIVTTGLAELQEKSVTSDGRRSLADARAATAELGHITERARKALAADQSFSAADTVFTEGTTTAKDIDARIAAARRAERDGAALSQSSTRSQQARAAGAVAGAAAVVIGLLAWLPRRTGVVDLISTSPNEAGGPAELWLRDPPSGTPLPRETVPILKAAVDVCTDLNRARELSDLTGLLERAAATMDAVGIIVWVGRPGGSSLRPVLAHGYPPEALARMPPVPRAADNAPAAAARTGALQIVLTRPGVSSGALAAPMLSPEGSIGALTVEIANGGETSEGVQALASIFAAQLAGLLAASVTAEVPTESRASA